MGLFLDTPSATERPPMSNLAVASLIVAVTGFGNIIGFIAGPVLAHMALVRIRRAGTAVRGRGLAIAALWISYGALAVAAVALLALLISLIVAYAALPQPDFF